MVNPPGISSGATGAAVVVNAPGVSSGATGAAIMADPPAPPQAQPEQPSWVAALSAGPTPMQPDIEQRPPQTQPAQPFLPVEQPVADVELTHKAPPPAARPNPFLEDNLETTMKRPAIRLQPVQRNNMKEPPTARNRSMERQPATNEGNSSAQDRLLKGYQHQLVGDYDDAMQEYRILIRTSPDLLSEVVSNLRALLKLAPKYSAGYRVLGDAYMRQGEYLQAMEAYNKALTMAKKAKS
ncbi:tetratricopeptide repeat protein [Ktedonospora formicarum]|uniref:Tetratricopeptide repeat protein n=1 Tax=Ktedonospora formicarum TaxID=2778364 RepID=A0A8J3MT78_9CHLR|nr:tetratricopeptide repeat protein [Ktedonospora formicarum]GHO45611.1 hypothetical protein KSX_37740 [Ktedonospora formicarum]